MSAKSAIALKQCLDNLMNEGVACLPRGRHEARGTEA